MWKMIHRNYRRFVAFMLTAVMVLTNVGMNLTVAFAAGETVDALFLVDRAELKAAIREAKEEGEVFEFSSLELKAEKKSIKNQYEKLLGAKDGEVYQLDVDVDSSYAPEYTSVEVFYHSQSQNVVFLFVNESDLVADFRVNISGYETAPVTVKPNTFNVEDGENPSYAENYETGDMIDDVQKKLGAEVLNSQETSATEEETSSETVEGEEMLPSEEAGKNETDSERTEEGSEADTESFKTDQEAEEEKEALENDAIDESRAVPEVAEQEKKEEETLEEPEESAAEAVSEEEPEAEAASDEGPQENSEAENKKEELLSMSRHPAAVVAVSADILEDGMPEDAEVIAEKPGTEDRDDTENEALAAEVKADDSDSGTGSDETGTEREEEQASGVQGEVNKPASGKSRPEANEGEVIEGKTGYHEAGSEKSKDSSEAGSEEGGDSEAGNNETEGNDNSGEDNSGISEETVDGNEEDRVNGSSGYEEKEELEGQLLEGDEVEACGKLEGKEYSTVTIRDHANAKAFRVAWEDILNIPITGEDEEIQRILDAIEAVIENYQDGAYETDEELESAVDEIMAWIEELGEDDEYPDELLDAIIRLQEILGLGVRTLEAEECTCEYMCTWFWGSYININKDCPVCSHATEEELDPYTYDPDHPEDFVCKGKQVVIPGKKPDCKHNAVINGGSLWGSWFPGGGSPDLLEASCQWPATNKEAIECMNCGARWLWSFDEYSRIDPETHYFGKNKPEIITEATCTEDGLQKQTCVFCGDIETVIKGGHKRPKDESQITITEATCKDGSVEYTCVNCQKKITEVLPGHHTFPTGSVPKDKNGVCTVCGATAYEVFTYEDGATPSGSGYETKFCARVIAEKDGEIYGVDKDGRRLEDEEFSVIINEFLMGKNKSGFDKDGNMIMTQVVGYRNMDDDDGQIYKIGEKIAYTAVPDMFADEWGSWGNYYSGNNRKVVYLKAVREEIADGFKVGKVRYDFAPSASNPGLRKGIADTTVLENTEYDDKRQACIITYTIPGGYTEDTIDINATRAVKDAYRKYEEENFGSNGTQPGDTLGPVFIRIVNQSDKTYFYDNNSIVLQSESQTGETPYLGEIHTFDGTEVPEASVPSRVSNGALRYLYNTTTDKKGSDLTDEVLGERLKEKGYENGIEDLHQFYLDYYNYAFSDRYGKTWSNLSEVPYELLVQRDEGIFGGQSPSAGLKETNPEVAGVGYSFMYTRLLSVVMGSNGNAKDPDGIYAVGNYMKGENAYTELNEKANEAWGELQPGQIRMMEGMNLYFNGESNDFYQNTAWAVEYGLRLRDKRGTVEVTKSVTGSGGETEKEFPFEITLSGSLNRKDLDFFKQSHNLVFEKEEGKNLWKAVFRLKDGETQVISGIPVGTEYKIEETGKADYHVTVKAEDPIAGEKTYEDTAVVSGTIQVEENEGITAVRFNNHKDTIVKTGNLEVRKTVSGGGASTTREFTFTVTLGDRSINGEYGDMNFENGVATFKLAHGQSRMARNLPAGISYEVTESDYAGYTSASTDEKGEIPEATIITAAFDNYRGGGGSNDGGGGGSNPGGGSSTPGGPGTTTNIDEPAVPLANFPGEPVTELIQDSDVPLAALPRTGDSRHTGILLMMLGLAGIGAILSAAGLRKRKDESGDR